MNIEPILILSEIPISKDYSVEIYLQSNDKSKISIKIQECKFGYLLKLIFNVNYNYLDFLEYVNNFIKNSNNVSRETIIQNLNRKLELVKDDYLLNTIDDNVDENNLRTITVKISNQHGIHARPASILVKLVQSFESTIWIRNSRKEIINAKDFLQILTMELKNNDCVEIIAQGKDAESALKCLELTFRT